MRNMDKIMRKLAQITGIIVLLVGFMCSAYAQKKERVYMSMDYKQVVNEYRLVEVSVRTKIDGKFYPLVNAPIEVTMDAEDGDISLASVYSNYEGIAQLVITKDYHFMKDEEGFYTLRAKYDGNDTLKSAKKKAKAKDLVVAVDCILVDSVKTIKLNAIEILGDTLTGIPESIDFDVYVDRMFADLKVAEGEILDGIAKITFPDDIPGDAQGNLILKIIIDERAYQAVELNQEVNWGVVQLKEKKKNPNIATISYVVFMIVGIIVTAIIGLLLSKRVNNKS